MQNFDRQYRLIAGQAGQVGFEIGEGPTPLHVSFSFQKADLKSQNTGKVSIWNLNPQHLAELSKDDCVVSLKAGYGSVMPLIFTGVVTYTSTSLDGADRCTQLELVDNRIEVRDTYVSVSYSGTVNTKTLIQDAADQMGVAVTFSYNAEFVDLPNGFSFVGPAKDVLTKACDCSSLQWSIQNGVLQVKKPGDVMSKEVYVLSPDTGLLGIPKQIQVSDDKDTSKAQHGWDVEYLMNAAINIDDYVKLLTNVADKIAELWEYGSDIYYSQYPATAEGISLDNAAQYGGSTRGSPAPSYYHVLCTGIDGTVIPSGTLIASDTNPATQLVISEQKEITRSFFNKAAVKVTSTQLSGVFTVALNGNPYSITPTGTPTTTDVLKALSAAINDDAFLVSVDEEAALLRIEAVDEASANVLLLSENLTTDTVGSVITFATEEAGDILLPNGVITKIVKAVPGLQSVVNVGSYIAGQLTETDTEFRQSYADKIFSMSSRMLESIRSAILDNCQGVTSVAPYENDSNEVDDMGRWPHSVEVVVDGGDANEIARQILNTKAGGINTFGSVEVSVPGEYGEEITVRFNRPTYLKVWMRVGVTMSRSSTLPSNYADLIKAAILDRMDTLDTGSDVVPQKLFLGALYSTVTGMDYADITMAAGESKPATLDQRSITVTPRERAILSEERIEVVISG